MPFRTKKEILRRVEELGSTQPWNHNFLLPFGVQTRPSIANSERHGKSTGKWKWLRPYLESLDLSGKRVLDVGCNEGFFSLRCRELGAREVVGIDINPQRIEKAHFIIDVLQPSAVQFVQRDLFGPDLPEIGRFDVAMCLGVLHRVPNPYGALCIISALADQVVIEWRAFHDKEGRSLLWYRRLVNESDPDNTSYFFPTVTWVEEVLHEQGLTYSFVDDDSPWNRAVVIASRSDAPLFQRGNVRRRTSVVNELRARCIGRFRCVRQFLTGRAAARNNKRTPVN